MAVGGILFPPENRLTSATRTFYSHFYLSVLNFEPTDYYSIALPMKAMIIYMYCSLLLHMQVGKSRFNLITSYRVRGNVVYKLVL